MKNRHIDDPDHLDGRAARFEHTVRRGIRVNPDDEARPEGANNNTQKDADDDEEE